ncbi:hypothetical protein NLJ89_g1461 [Agrocybe chaxingu]|uniref:DNA 3'-5' helicase n=1 Tax=Agrocybe chaxingu TaxID=84603 RepID=A0A9W8N023_9AGAR|nr:hypothetical protein NLJ89_g1461 [Agrocybe chaxingu]
MSSVPPANPDELPPFSWTSIEGRAVIREVVEQQIPQWGNGPRDVQLDCWAGILARTPTVLIASTGWGKTSVFFVPIIILRHLLEHPRPRIAPPPPLPVALLVTPLIESEMHIWSIVLLSAERLASKDVDRVIRSEHFRQNLVLVGIDEAHVLVPWGKTFRTAYQQISSLRKRLPAHTAVVAVTATLARGREERALFKELGLKEGRFRCIRLPSERPNVRMVFKELTHTLGSYQFPDIAWVFRPGVKAILYCKTIDLCFRVALYGWNQYEAGSRRLDNVRLWTSITSSGYNTRTLDLFQNDPNTSAIVATIAFGMGMNLRNITDSVNLGLPDSLSALHQQNGRAGRDLSSVAQGWTYIEPTVLSAVSEDMEDEEASAQAKRKGNTTKGKKRAEDLDAGLRAVLEAYLHGFCLVAATNAVLGDDNPKGSLSCEGAGRPLPCSNCQPMWNNPMPTLPPTTTPPLSSSVSLFSATPSTTKPTHKPYPKYIQDNALLWLDEFAMDRWSTRDDLIARLLPHPAIWSGISPQLITESLHLLHSRAALDEHLKGWQYLSTDGDVLFSFIQNILTPYDHYLQQVKERRVRRAAETRAKNQKGSYLCLLSRKAVLNN